MASLSVSDSFDTTTNDGYYSEKGYLNYNPNHNQQKFSNTDGNINLCRYFMQGYCSRGDRCHFAHVTNLAQIQNRNQPILQFNTSVKLPSCRSRKSTGEEEVSNIILKMNNSGRLEDVIGQVYTLSKDQFGCRYLQKQIEEHNQLALDLFFPEIFPHITELMTDPFGNYLCQKLVEMCTTEQRNMILNEIIPSLVNICLNMHGTRAAQKLIEFVNTQQQIDLIKDTLKLNSIILIKDLNGNHVIQRCLFKFKPQDSQFIFDSIMLHCIEVASHRHGCCVMQRCIDNSSEKQRHELVIEIAKNSLILVQVFHFNRTHLVIMSSNMF